LADLAGVVEEHDAEAGQHEDGAEEGCPHDAARQAAQQEHEDKGDDECHSRSCYEPLIVLAIFRSTFLMSERKLLWWPENRLVNELLVALLLLLELNTELNMLELGMQSLPSRAELS